MAVLAPIVTVFERIPRAFVDAYDAEFQKWGRDLKRIGQVAMIRFRMPLRPSSILQKDQRVIIGARLRIDFDKGLGGHIRAVIRPLDDAAQDAIERHTAELTKVRLQ